MERRAEGCCEGRRVGEECYAEGGKEGQGLGGLEGARWKKPKETISAEEEIWAMTLFSLQEAPPLKT